MDYKGSIRAILRQFQQDEAMLLANLTNQHGDAKQTAKDYARTHIEDAGYLAVGRMKGQAWNPWCGGRFYFIFRGHVEEVSWKEAVQKEETEEEGERKK